MANQRLTLEVAQRMGAGQSSLTAGVRMVLSEYIEREWGER